MNKSCFIAIVCCTILLTSCAKKGRPAVKIGKIEVSQEEFEQAFQDSRYPAQREGRKAFLKSFVRKKIILQEAERQGLDKNPAFLRDIQIYWEQGLLKEMLSRKSERMTEQIVVSDQEIQSYYEQNKKVLFMQQELSNVRGQIKWLLFQKKQNEAMTAWVDSLENKVKVEIDPDLVGLQ